MDFYWELFTHSGDVEDYMKYKILEQKNNGYRKTNASTEPKPYRKLMLTGGF